MTVRGGTQRRQVRTIRQRRICWPEPDATCIEGGCSWCNDNPWRSVESIRRYCEKAGTLRNRYGGTSQDAMQAFRYGESRGWNNAQTREWPK